jgi:hypothetical protein
VVNGLSCGPLIYGGNPFRAAFTVVGSACLLAPVPADPPASAELPIRGFTPCVVGKPDRAAQFDDRDPWCRRDVWAWPGRRPRGGGVAECAGFGGAWLAHQQPCGPDDADEGVRGLGAVCLLGARFFGVHHDGVCGPQWCRHHPVRGDQFGLLSEPARGHQLQHPVRAGPPPHRVPRHLGGRGRIRPIRHGASRLGPAQQPRWCRGHQCGCPLLI